MIVYNEEKHIRRCLDSAFSLVDEIIIVDTGSTDNTKAICKEYGARIFDFSWNGDFAAARNYSVAQARGQWILLLDADEVLQISNAAGLRRYLRHTPYDFIPLRMIHFFGHEPADQARAHFFGATRLLRNGGPLNFRGIIHERLEADPKAIAREIPSWHWLEIFHYGYMEEAASPKTKRNIFLLLKQKTAQPDDPWLHYYLAAEYYRAGALGMAYEEVIAALAGFLAHKHIPPALAYKLKYDILINSFRYDVAAKGIDKAIAIYPDYVDLHFYKGILQYRRHEYEKACHTFSHCLNLGEYNLDYLILSGSGSFLARHYLRLSAEAMLVELKN